MTSQLASTIRLSLALAATMLVTASAGRTQTPRSPEPPGQSATAAPQRPTPLPITQAFEKAALEVLTTAKVPAGTKADLVIDPLIDGNTGAQSSSTRRMEDQLKALIAARFADKFEVLPFTPENLSRKPFLFIGTFTPVHSKVSTTAPRDAYRIWFTILDLKAGLIAAKGVASAAGAGIAPVPTPAFAEGPVWVPDAAIGAYVNTCQAESRPGDPIHSGYLERIDVASVISLAITAYDEGRFQEALELYTKARSLPGGDQLRVHNGLYLSNLKLDRRADADAALRDLVDYGLKSERLGVKMLFVPNTTQFISDAIAASYPQWLRTIADRSAENKVCLELVGHASRSGSEAFNDQLSKRRAEAVKDQLADIAPALATNMKASGSGWRENIVGTGRDDATDALDRRVEFKVKRCPG
jgi:outer membrane protein OmpA-like peptidoglycan-associated protein